MTERLLQFIWQLQYFDQKELQTLDGESLRIADPGKLNKDQGPDFSSAKIQVGNTAWSGNIEIHVLASDWYKHNHEGDRQYSNVILHVVWKYDLNMATALEGISTLELQPRVAGILLDRYEQLMHNTSFVPCEKSLENVHELIWINWKERLLIERLQRKSAYVIDLLRQNNHHWEETFWWMLARSFGMLVNADAFESIARSIPLSLLARHKNQIHQLESLLFGQAGLLGKRVVDSYPLLLQKEYRFFKQKYSLKQVPVSLKFLRMRPSSFPSVRLAQLAMLIHTSDHLFSVILGKNNLADIKGLLNVTANDYWHYHYRFDEECERKVKNTGEDMVNLILINTIIPVLYAYGTYRNEEAQVSKVMRWLEEMTAEKNRITKGWAACGIQSRNALESQALLELKLNYCDYKRCLDCNVGNTLLKRNA